MEYIDGETLQARLDRMGPLEPHEAVRLGRQIALGLAAAHATGVIHRDIKPANILLEKGDPARVKISDFGIARTADDASLTQSGIIMGTPLYMSPEQANGDPVDHRADLFSLGSVLYTMVSGRPPFRAPNTMAVLGRVVYDKPRSLREVNPSVGDGLRMVIERLDAKAPAERYQTAAEAAQALEHCLTGNPAPVTPRRRSRGLIRGAAAAALLIAAAIGLAASGLFGHNDAAPPDTGPEAAVNPAPLAPAQPARPAPKPNPALAWEDAVAAMPVGDQAPAVNARLRVLNPSYNDSGFSYTIKDGVVDTMTLRSGHLTNLSPLRALRNLRELTIESQLVNGLPLHSPLKDLGPLRGMKLEAFHCLNASIDDLAPLAGSPLQRLTVWGYMGEDLLPLRGMKLTYLNCGLSNVRDLSPLRSLPLTFLCVNMSQVADLSPLEGMSLNNLLIEKTHVTDLSPILNLPITELAVRGSPVSAAEVHRVRALPLKHLLLDYEPARDLEFLRSIKTLERVNHQPLTEFLAMAGR